MRGFGTVDKASLTNSLAQQIFGPLIQGMGVVCHDIIIQLLVCACEVVSLLLVF